MTIPIRFKLYIKLMKSTTSTLQNVSIFTKFCLLKLVCTCYQNPSEAVDKIFFLMMVFLDLLERNTKDSPFQKPNMYNDLLQISRRRDRELMLQDVSYSR